MHTKLFHSRFNYFICMSFASILFPHLIISFACLNYFFQLFTISSAHFSILFNFLTFLITFDYF